MNNKCFWKLQGCPKTRRSGCPSLEHDTRCSCWPAELVPAILMVCSTQLCRAGGLHAWPSVAHKRLSLFARTGGRQCVCVCMFECLILWIAAATVVFYSTGSWCYCGNSCWVARQRIRLISGRGGLQHTQKRTANWRRMEGLGESAIHSNECGEVELPYKRLHVVVHGQVQRLSHYGFSLLVMDVNCYLFVYFSQFFIL